MKIPTAPTEAERQLHNLTHLPYRTWCNHCFKGKGKEQHHLKLASRSPTVQLDYHFLAQPKRQLGPNEAPNESNTTYLTVLCAHDSASGLGLEVVVERKGLCKTAEAELTKFLVETGRSNSTLLGDNETALIAQMTRLIKNLGTSATYRLTPNFSPASKGNCEYCTCTTKHLPYLNATNLNDFHLHIHFGNGL